MTNATTLTEAKILIVDDEPLNVRLLERMLEDAGYHQTRATTDPRQVVRLHAEVEPDLILLDLMMPHLDGIAVLQELRRQAPASAYVPVLVLTADATVAAKRRALDAGANDFLTKPFDAVEVVLRIRNLLSTRFLHLELERHKDHLEEEIRQRTQQLLQTEKLAAMGGLLAGVAHELNNPMSVILGQASLLRETAVDARSRERGEKIRSAAARCSRIVKNFLSLARHRPIERQDCDLNAIVREAVELVAYPLRMDNVTVRLQLDPGLPRLWADQHQLGQVVVNLITNAHQAMRETAAPRILTLTTGCDPGRLRVFAEVSDSGPGIPPELRDKIFDPFFTTKPPGEGTGLGLHLSRTMVQDQGGSLRVEDRPGPGAVFRLEVPAGTGHEAAVHAPTAEPTARLAGRTILVVDDEPALSEILTELLSTDGASVDVARDGLEALERIEGGRYDAILSDLKMPRLDGPGLYQEVVRRRPDLVARMIFMTGDALGSAGVAFLDRIENPRIGKPFTTQGVLEVVRKTAARGGPRPTPSAGAR